MKIGFMGLGKLGLPCALAVEVKGHEVIGYDPSTVVQGIIKSKKIPYKEIWAQEHLDKSNIRIASISNVVGFSDIIFVPVQTPHNEKYEGITRLPDERVDFDYTFIKTAIEELSNEIKEQGQDKIVIIISTVLPGTVERELKPLLNKHVKLCYNPFFIAMGTTMRDFLHPELVLFGVDDEEAAKTAEKFYKTIHDAPFYKTTIANAELTKVIYNTFISMKIGFINTVMEICHKTDANVDAISDALSMATDRVISTKYLRGGMGDGGGCHPRDNIALSWLSRELNLSYDFFESIMICREKQTEWLVKLIRDEVLIYPDHPVIILGAAFKKETNLTVGSPALLLSELLNEKNIKHDVFDPFINEGIDSILNVPAIFFIGTNHDEFLEYEFPKGSVVIDPWRIIENQSGIKVIRIGE